MSLRTILSNYGPVPCTSALWESATVWCSASCKPDVLRGLPGRPQEDRAALARAFIAKAVFAIKPGGSLASGHRSRAVTAVLKVRAF